MATSTLKCAHCGKRFERERGHINRQRRNHGNRVPFFCSQACTGLRRRVERSAAEWKQLKADYDQEYRARYGRMLRRKKREYHRRTYDPNVAREHRKARMAWHVAYCREYYADPKRKAAKVRYDLKRRAAAYGAYADAHVLLVKLEKLIRQKSPDKYQRAVDRGYYERQNLRKRTRHAEGR